MDRSIEQKIDDFLTSCFYSILNAEEKALSQVDLSLSEIHLIDAVIKAKEQNVNNFSTIAQMLNITLGSLTKAYNKLENKGYLTKTQDNIDKRIFYIIPTEIAYFTNQKHLDFHKNMVASISEKLSAKKLAVLRDALASLAEFFAE